MPWVMAWDLVKREITIEHRIEELFGSSPDPFPALTLRFPFTFRFMHFANRYCDVLNEIERGQ